MGGGSGAQKITKHLRNEIVTQKTSIQITISLIFKIFGDNTPSGLRLIGGSWPGEGRVEIYYQGSWGTVCDDLWDIDDAQVVCRHLGYSYAFSARHRAWFGKGSGKIWLDDVQCQGDESSIGNCRHSSWGVHNCGHSEDASVICSSKRDNK